MPHTYHTIPIHSKGKAIDGPQKDTICSMSCIDIIEVCAELINTAQIKVKFSSVRDLVE